MKHFKAHEFKCKCGTCGCAGEIHPELGAWLDRIRERVGRPVVITSGRRCLKHNKAVGGSAVSQHITGNAADLLVRNMDPRLLAVKATRELPQGHRIGLGVYTDARGGGWVHIDVGGRGRDATWAQAVK